MKTWKKLISSICVFILLLWNLLQSTGDLPITPQTNSWIIWLYSTTIVFSFLGAMLIICAEGDNKKRRQK